MNTLDPRHLQIAARQLQIAPAFVEKDWYVVQMLRLISQWSAEGQVRPIFTGGTSLSKAHQVIRRFSEDVDLRLEALSPLSRKGRSRVKHDFLAALEAGGWHLEDIRARNENQYLGLSIRYPVEAADPHLRPFLKIEMIYKAPRLPVVSRSVSSFLATLTGEAPEVSGIACLALEEIAAEKLSALCWRLDDPKQPDRIDLVRHLHDLACVSDHLSVSPAFSALVLETVGADLEDRSMTPEDDAREKLRNLPAILAAYKESYTRYVRETSYADSNDPPPDFDTALNRLETLLSAL